MDYRLFSWDNCTILRGDSTISTWPITSQLEQVYYHSDGELKLDHTKAGDWEDLDNGLEGNAWIVVNLDGRWYAATFEWLRDGQVDKHVEPFEFGQDQIREAPLDASWEGPQPGEVVGFFVSTPARSEVRTTKERSGIVWVKVDGDEVGEERGEGDLDVDPDPYEDPPDTIEPWLDDRLKQIQQSMLAFHDNAQQAYKDTLKRLADLDAKLTAVQDDLVGLPGKLPKCRWRF